MFLFCCTLHSTVLTILDNRYCTVCINSIIYYNYVVCIHSCVILWWILSDSMNGLVLCLKRFLYCCLDIKDDKLQHLLLLKASRYSSAL